MSKIPVGATIAHAYSFAFGQFLRVLGIVWAPLLVSIAFALLITPGFLGNHIDVADKEEIARQSMKLLPLSLVVTIIIRAMIATGVTEFALGQRTGLTLVYFSLGASVWRFVGAWLLVILVMFLLMLGGALVIGILAAVGGIALGAAGHGTIGAWFGLFIGVVAIAYYFALIYAAVRLTFFIPPVIVAEKKIDLARGWQLARGNFWRIFIVGLVIFLPLIIVGCVLFWTLYGAVFFAAFKEIFTMAMNHAKPEAIQAVADKLEISMRETALRVWPYTAVTGLILGTLGYGLGYGACAFAYKAVTPDGGRG